jgi:pimeloyl-ACP methyl ester carboxylesterase
MFIHGWLGSWRYWVSSMDALSENHRVYAFDLWGFGDSDKANNQYTVDSYVHLLHSFLTELGVMGRVPLVGHALGATVAVSFALQYPDMIDRVMAVSLPMGSERVNRRILFGGSSILDRVLGRSPTAGYADVEQEAGRTAPDAIQASVESVAEVDLGQQLSALNVPLLAVYGEQDNIVLPPAASAFDGLGPLVRMLTMPECRHFPMLDRSSQFNRLLQDFLDASEDLSELDLKDEWQRRIR